MSADPGCSANSMVHYFGPPAQSAAAMFDEAGHPPNCPAYCDPGGTVEHADQVLPERTWTTILPGVHVFQDGGAPVRIVAWTRRRAQAVHALTSQEPKSREPAPPVAETPAARAVRLDRAAKDAQRAYAAAVQAADAAWREIGGRP